MLAIPGSNPPDVPSVRPNRLSCRFVRKTPSLGSPDTIRQPTGMTAHAGAFHVKPHQDAASSCTCRHQHTPVEAGSAGQEAFEVVDGREAGPGIVEGQEFAVHGPPAAAWDVVPPELGVRCACGELRGQTHLCGHVGERVGGDVSQDVRLGHLQDRDTEREFVQATPDGRLLHGKEATAEPLVVPVALLAGRVDKVNDSLENSMRLS